MQVRRFSSVVLFSKSSLVFHVPWSGSQPVFTAGTYKATAFDK
jgi:hypothetical protein